MGMISWKKFRKDHDQPYFITWFGYSVCLMLSLSAISVHVCINNWSWCGTWDNIQPRYVFIYNSIYLQRYFLAAENNNNTIKVCKFLFCAKKRTETQRKTSSSDRLSFLQITTINWWIERNAIFPSSSSNLSQIIRWLANTLICFHRRLFSGIAFVSKYIVVTCIA